MLFVALSDAGILTTPIQAVTLQDAADQLRQIYGVGGLPVRLALLTPAATATIIPHPTDPTQATLQVTGDALAQKNLRDQAKAALADNQTFLGISSPNNAQVVAQVQALTRQANGLIRLALGEVS